MATRRNNTFSPLNGACPARQLKSKGSQQNQVDEAIPMPLQPLSLLLPNPLSSNGHPQKASSTSSPHEQSRPPTSEPSRTRQPPATAVKTIHPTLRRYTTTRLFLRLENPCGPNIYVQYDHPLPLPMYEPGGGHVRDSLMQRQAKEVLVVHATKTSKKLCVDALGTPAVDVAFSTVNLKGESDLDKRRKSRRPSKKRKSDALPSFPTPEHLLDHQYASEEEAKSKKQKAKQVKVVEKIVRQLLAMELKTQNASPDDVMAEGIRKLKERHEHDPVFTIYVDDKEEPAAVPLVARGADTVAKAKPASKFTKKLAGAATKVKKQAVGLSRKASQVLLRSSSPDDQSVKTVGEAGAAGKKSKSTRVLRASEPMDQHLVRLWAQNGEYLVARFGPSPKTRHPTYPQLQRKVPVAQNCNICVVLSENSPGTLKAPVGSLMATFWLSHRVGHRRMAISDIYPCKGKVRKDP